MKTKKLSIAAQLFLFILGSAIIVALIVGSVAYSNMGSFLQKKCKDDVMEIDGDCGRKTWTERFCEGHGGR